MGYLFLALGILSGVSKGYCGKKTSGYIRNYSDAYIVYVIRMIICIIIGAAFAVVETGGFSCFKIDKNVIVICLVGGFALATNLIAWVIAVRKSAYMMLDVFTTMFTAVPLILSSIFFGEKIKPIQWLGFVMLIIASLIMSSYNNKIKEKITFGGLMVIITCGAMGGLQSFTQKWFMKTTENTPVSVFNFYLYCITFVMLVLAFLVANKGNIGDKELYVAIKPTFFYVVIMAIALFLNMFFITKSAGLLDSVKTYPLNSGACLSLSMIMAGVLFKEKITKRCIVGILITFASLLLINLA